MAKFSEDVFHLRELAGQCRRAAARMDDQTDIQSLSHMAVEYELLAKRIEKPLIANAAAPVDPLEQERLRECSQSIPAGRKRT